MTTTNHSITVTIDGTNRTTLLLRDSLSARTTMQNGSSVCDFILDDVGSYTPAAWDVVTIKVGAVQIFGGYIANRVGDTVGAGGSKRARWAVSCRDWTMLFDKVIVNANYKGLTDDAIVTNLINTYVTGDGFTLTNAQTTKYNLSMGFENMTLREALNKVASEVDATWFVDATQKVYWFNRYSPPVAAFSVDTSGTLAGYTAPRFGTLRRTIDDSAVFNRITVYGRAVQGDRVAENTVTNASGTEYEFELDYYPHSIAMVEVSLANGRESLQGSQIGYEPDNILYGETGDAARIVYVLCNREKRTVKIRTPLGMPIATSSVLITYYKARQIVVTVNDTGLQATHGRVLEAQIYNQYLATDADATAYGEALIKAWGHGKESVTFDVTEFGLLPATRLIIYSPEVGASAAIDYLLKQDGDNLLWEDDGLAEKESDNNLSGVYIIQSVNYKCVKTPAGYMVIASVQCGEYEQSIIDILSALTGGAGAGSLPSQYLLGRLSDAASDLGIIVAGQAVFTDGGTAPYTWGTPNNHTGIVLGLNAAGTPAAGELYIYEDGVTRLKLGPMAGLGTVGTVTPSGYGIWTDNGYFQGVVAASSIVGGTVTGGTITGALVQSGTVRTSTALVNSSNPGITMDSTGLYGYGTAGLTFALSSNPAVKPYFSSGTITNVVYEITTAAVLRTGTANPRIQIDNSGIFAYAPGTATVPKFSVDVATGLMTATGATFSGAISASTVTGGTVTAGAMNAMAVTGGTITGGVIRTGTATAKVQMTTAGLFGTNSAGGTVFSVSATTGLMTASGASFSGSVSASTITGGTVSGGIISGGTITGATINGGTIAGSAIFSTDGAYMFVGTVADYSASGKFYFRVATVNRSYISAYKHVATDADELRLAPYYGGGNYGTVAVTGDFRVDHKTTLTDGIIGDLNPTSNTQDLGGSNGYYWRYIYMWDAGLGTYKRLSIYNGAVTVV